MPEPVRAGAGDAGRGPLRFVLAAACADRLIAELGRRIVLALPLGLGKAAALVNALYARARTDPTLELEICTALSLEAPRARGELDGRLLEPIAARLFEACPMLDYASDQRSGRLPANVRVVEFYFRPGANLGVPLAQQNYASLNYTHAAREMLARGVNVVAQMVSAAHVEDGIVHHSLSCNPDVTLDLLDAARMAGGPLPLLVGEVNPALPFMPHDAALPEAAFDCLLDDPVAHAPLFPVPNRPVALAEHAIALRVAGLVRDGGTLQIGIGSLGDAIAHAIALRHTDNAVFRALMQALATGDEPMPLALETFTEGLYGCSEMFVEGFLHLRSAGVLRRAVRDGIYMHGGFFLGSARFYDALRSLPTAERTGIAMTRISFTNSLHGDEMAKRRDRVHGRFVNTAMMLTLLGAAVSDGLDDGRVVSGVGGQYNFVAMAHELAGARSILMVPATRTARGVVSSNIVWNYGHTTIPRHLRDVAVTEYGVADLRGRSDRDVIVAMLKLADSRFQEALRAQAVAAGKLEADYRIPATHTGNLPDVLAASLAGAGGLGALPWFPLGSDFSELESALAIGLGALGELQGDRRALGRLVLRGMRLNDARLAPLLARVGLDRPRGIAARLQRAALAAVLHEQVLTGARPILPVA